MMKERKNITFKGKIIEKGISVGEIRVASDAIKPKKETAPMDILKELFRFKNAKKEAAKQLLELYEKVFADIGEEGASMIMAYQAILEDPEFIDEIKRKINVEGVRAEEAVSTTAERFENLIGDLDDEYMKARRADIKDVAGRLLECLKKDSDSNSNEAGSDTEDPKVFLTTEDGKHIKSSGYILLAEELTPTKALELNREELGGIVTYKGSENSHTAIIARSMKIPALILEEFSNQKDFCDILSQDIEGKIAIVDGNEGILIINPDSETLTLYEEAKNIPKKDIKSDGTQKSFAGYYANVNSLEDVYDAAAAGFDGIGLFRTEFLFMAENDFPSEEKQFEVYKKAAETMKGKPVIIRTFDLGSDKQASYMKLDNEKNPALGLRGIKLELKYEKELKKQIKAAYKASAFGNIKIMYPMISTLDELLAAKKIAAQAKSELEAEGIDVNEVEQGITIETPAAAFLSDRFAKEADFISIGTNDLTQYMYASDRENLKASDFVDKSYEAVFRAVKMIVENVHSEGKEVSVCGELAANKEFETLFKELGADKLSIAVR